MAFIPRPASQPATESVSVKFETVTVLPRWLCLYCHTVQAGDNTDCCNCGAPRDGLREAEQLVSDAIARRLGLRPIR